MRRCLPMAWTTIVLLGAPGAVRADAIEACVSSATAGQKDQKGGKLRDARAEFLQCVKPECPAEVRTVCDRLLSGVEASMPTVIASARSADGQDLVAVRVLVDGAPLLDSLDGKAIAVDPGPHVLSFEQNGRPPLAVRVVIREAEKNRLVSVSFPPPRPAPEPPPTETPTTRPTPVGVYVLAGVGVVSLGAFGYLALHGQNQFDDCSGNKCSPSTVDALSLERYLAFGALGIGVVSLGAAAYLFWVRPERPSPHLSIGLLPVRGGGGLWTTTSF